MKSLSSHQKDGERIEEENHAPHYVIRCYLGPVVPVPPSGKSRLISLQACKPSPPANYVLTGTIGQICAGTRQKGHFLGNGADILVGETDCKQAELTAVYNEGHGEMHTGSGTQ